MTGDRALCQTGKVHCSNVTAARKQDLEQGVPVHQLHRPVTATESSWHGNTPPPGLPQPHQAVGRLELGHRIHYI